MEGRQKIKIREYTAGEITAKALEELEANGARVRRVNNVGAYKKRKHQVKAGWPDIQGYSRAGLIILCEVKKIGDTLKDAQTSRLMDCKQCGGLAFIATQDKITGKFILKEFDTTTPM